MRVLVMVLLSLLPLSSCDPGSKTLHINLSPSNHPTSPGYGKKLPLFYGSHMLQVDFLSKPEQAPSKASNFLLKVLNQARVKILGSARTQLQPHERLTLINSAPSPAPALSPKHHGKSKRPHHRSKHHRKIHLPISPTSFDPPQGQDCDEFSCSEPLTQAPFGSPCGCVFPMQVVIDLSVPPYQLFPRIAELEVEVAAGTYLKQSQVRIMAANASIRDPGWTSVAMDLVPLVEKFDNMTALLTYERFWQKKVPLDMSLFGDYQVIYVHYPGLPSSPPTLDESSASGPAGSHQYPFTANVPSSMRTQKMNARTIAVIALSAFMLVLVCSGVTCFLLKWRNSSERSATTIGPAFTSPVTKRSGFKSMKSSSLASSTSVSFVSTMATCPPTVKTFSLAELEVATEKFSSNRILGEGGFGRVYHGIMDDGSEAAIKLLTREDQSGDREFIAEVEMLSRLHHRNLVKLIGICVEKRTRCLVYELVRNGSVESHLHGADKSKAPLDWEARMKIALGAARGLAYLHEDSNPRVIHRDFKASNVLLEEDFTPKVSDFGLAREATEGSHHISTRVMGTFGYVAPEYAMTGHLLVKSDVYSYGVVLLELLSGRKPVYMSQSQGPENLVTWARPLLTSREGVQQLLDPSLCGNYDFHNVAKVAAIASMCVHTEASQRPFMGEVVQALKLICNDMDETCEDSYSQRDSSSGPDSDFKGDFGLEHSWCAGGTPRLTYGSASPFVTMEYCSGPMEEIERRHSSNTLNLMSSCSFLSMIPIDDKLIDSRTDVFEVLAKGFDVYWSFGDLTMSELVHSCLGVCTRMFKENIKSDVVFSGIVSLVRSEKHFPACLDDYNSFGLKNFKLIFGISIVLVVLILFIQLLIVLALLGRFVFAPLAVCGFLLNKLNQMLASVDYVEKFLRSQQQTLAPTRYSYTDIIALTSHFKEKLGQGGFGSVYKGRLPGDRLLAIKMLHSSKSNGEDFINEVSTIGRIHHVNVVKLIGFCSDGLERALVYEYMPNGSLDKYIFSSSNSNHKFSSEKLNEIALGVARGINYLHEGCDMQILHFDIKPHNILLDHNFNPKVSDFGLAKLYPRDYNLVTVSAVRGTLGYMAPELISRSFGVISYKSDVYSFGMLLLEMASGKRNVDPRAENSSQVYYPSLIYDKLNQIPGEIVHDTETDIVINETEKKLCLVGLWCIQIRPSDRPPMSKVVEMLEGDVDSLQMPPKPFLATSRPEPSTMSYLNSSQDDHTTISEDD
ncbi:hypothetical protein J5N97_028792 [Dioscorea zingiberensis]|uniref:Protein kinase domain-containing protein n=1 Tax=Dioscorea zingiberensis TaxID=325984 RepID=A0A9D5BZS8_9LILI|nr:hypothetical protein J5N97_028792 [Dioscorea zingiberensis]